MTIKKSISFGLWIVGGLLLLMAFVSSGASILSLFERAQHGPGLFFADVGFLGLVAVISVMLGVAALFTAKKLSSKEQ